MEADQEVRKVSVMTGDHGEEMKVGDVAERSEKDTGWEISP